MDEEERARLQEIMQPALGMKGYVWGYQDVSLLQGPVTAQLFKFIETFEVLVKPAANEKIQADLNDQYNAIIANKG